MMEVLSITAPIFAIGFAHETAASALTYRKNGC
jgi:hypothetical protein